MRLYRMQSAISSSYIEKSMEFVDFLKL
jgi:hypothetical protein